MNAPKVFVVVSCLLLLPVIAWAQGAAAGAIVGVVRDTSGGVLPGVTVEATSPALIDQARTAVSDGEGRYRIVDLRPGPYTVTFSLPGFSTVRREGIEMSVGFTATVHADLAVGSIEQTIIVSGAAPIVDTQSSVQQTSLTADTLNALPTTRRMGSYADFLPAAKGTPDVGGLGGERGATFGIHGGRANEINVNQDGLNLTMLNSAVYSFNPNSVQEVVVEASGTSAETFSGGVRVNIVPKDGGNRFEGSANFTWSHPDLQSSNLSDELIARNLLETPALRRSYNVGGAFGGPIKRDKIWFFTAHRKWVASKFIPGNFFNRLNGTLLYDPDRDRPAYTTDFFRDHTLRLTAQVSEKDRLSLQFSGQDNCNCPNSSDASIAPEANGNHFYSPSMAAVATWTRPVTTRLLFEAGTSMNATTINSKRPEGTLLTSIAVNDVGLGVMYGSRQSNNVGNIGNPCCYSTQSVNHQYNQRAAVSYLTGSHAFKTGLTYQWYTFRNKNETAIDQIHGARAYTFRNQVPISVRIYATPFGRASDSTTIGMYAQDQWTIDRLTLNLGLRYDSFTAVAVAQRFAAGYFVGERNFPEVRDVPVWKNLNPRMGAAYDVFGTGRTAVKINWGRYVLGTSSTGNNNVALNQPILNQALQADRTWNDANGNFIPDCVLGPEVPGANGECGALSDQAFGQVREANANGRFATDVLRGFQDAQEYLWRGSVTFEHELRPGLGVNVGYFRTWYGNFQVVDNDRVTPDNFDEYCITAPVNARLPGGGGNQICGLWDIKPEKFGQVFNVTTQARNFGKRTDIYNGVDAGVSARFGDGMRLQGGVSTGATVTDNCFVVDSPQQLYDCRNEPSWASQTQVKFSAIYPLPWSLRASAVYQNVPGTQILANLTVSNALIAPSLGRNLGSCRGAAVCNGTTSVALIAPNEMFEDRRQQVDLRFSRAFEVGGARRVEVDLDLYNFFNANSVLQRNNTFGAAWQRVQEILPGRLVRVGLQVTF